MLIKYLQYYCIEHLEHRKNSKDDGKCNFCIFAGLLDVKIIQNKIQDFLYYI